MHNSIQIDVILKCVDFSRDHCQLFPHNNCVIKIVQKILFERKQILGHNQEYVFLHAILYSFS